MSKKVSVDGNKFKPNLPLEELLKNFEDTMTVLDPDDEDFEELWQEFSQTVCGCVSKILFDSKSPKKCEMDKASALLKKYREEGLFMNPTFYNQWIYVFRDELLKKPELLDFWKNEVVAKELGPCWARDCDFFDDSEDPEPANFYRHAGCEPAWLKENKKPNAPPLNLMANTCASGIDSSTSTDSGVAASLKKITKENALEDYKHNMVAQKNIDYDDEDAFKKIFQEARDVVWQLLFEESSLTAEKSKMAAALLQEYKKDACFFSPYDYNTWIEKVRDELFKRKYFDFWQIIVKEQLGLCWYKDSDYFDDSDDPKPLEFYKSGDELMKAQKK
uniref:Uncharacterized protein n=1 Tax=Stomoxys calcitrans TaxID=35570 RepID=A0A1I8PII1_STOCA